MYWTTPSGTRYQTGMPRPTRSRQSVEEIASAGTSTRLTAPVGRWPSARVKPGRVTPMKWASSNSSSLSRQLRIWLQRVGAGDEEQVGVRAAARAGRAACRWCRSGPPRSMSTRLTENRGLDAVAMTVIRYRSSAGLTSRSALLPRLAGRHEHDLVELEQRRDLAGRDQVAVVDGVERAAHHPDAAAWHRSSVSGWAAGRSRWTGPRPVGTGAPQRPVLTWGSRDRLPRAAGRRFPFGARRSGRPPGAPGWTSAVSTLTTGDRYRRLRAVSEQFVRPSRRGATEVVTKSVSCAALRHSTMSMTSP